MSDRAQIFTLEAFVAAIILVAALSVSLHAVGISSNTASVGETEQRSQHVGVVQGLIDGAVANDTLQPTLLYWDDSNQRFYDADPEEGFYISQGPNTTFGGDLDALLGDQGIRYNIDLHFQGADGTQETRRLVEYGTPTHDAVRVSETVTLYNDTSLVTRGNETPRENATLAEVESDFYAPNAGADSRVYNVIRVEVAVWRT